MLSKGQKINERYEILKSIGEGGMANVYLAHDIILNRDVAVKVLRGDLENDEKFIRRFQREAKSVSDLTSPNIVEVYDVGEEDGQHYIVMEYIDGKTLKQLIQKRGALTVAEVIDIMTQLTDGLAQAHDAYIIHRDIKPQNIMILDNGIIKITDFGIAMSINGTQLTQTNSVMGSVHYLPPEQASGQGATMKSDIYSAGILMYELLTGNVPFKGDNAVEIALKQMREHIPSVRKQNPLIPQSVENIVLKATAKNPKNRYDTIRQMHDDLVHALDSENENAMKWNYPYPESELDENKAIPIKEAPTYQSRPAEIDVPSKEEESLEEEILGDDNKNKKIKILVLVGVSILVVMVALLIFFNSRNNYKTIVVPDIEGMTVDKGVSLLKKKGFQYDIKSEASDSVSKGKIIRTNPKKGSSKKKGSIITIYESTGTKEVSLKDYKGQVAEDVKKKLESYGYQVVIEKETVDNPKDYVGKANTIIDQNPSYEDGKEATLKKEDIITLYVPDIYSEYPDVVSEGWTLSKVEEFAKNYGLVLSVKDNKGNTISDYSGYLDKEIASQNRKGNIASGVTFSVTIDLDTSVYKLTVNYRDKNGIALKDSWIKDVLNGDSKSVPCDDIKGYKSEKSSVSYTVNGADVSIICTYIKIESDDSSSDKKNNND